MKQPNIFYYATSELSQDAFLCYLLDFGKKEYKTTFPKEYALAHQFLELCGIDKKEEILSVHKQFKHIDTLVVTTNNVLIIEDKTYTNEHTHQIIRYVQNIKNEECFCDKKIKVCYFKMGDYIQEYVPPQDQTVLLKEDCCSLKREAVLNLLKNNQVDNLIFQNFYNYWHEIDMRKNLCDENDVFTWNNEKWFDYLCSMLQGHTFNGGWVHNPRGGFYGVWFDWYKIGAGEDYKQIEISFKEGKTS